MKYAIHNNNRIPASKGAKGTCIACGEELVPRCGELRMHHWAHKKDSQCDPWWENETQWHRNWKNQFPEEWQEKQYIDKETGEKHIADVCTNHGLVIEFQHSHIKPEERRSREAFYKNMIWVVDGSRLKGDISRFLDGMKELKRDVHSGMFLIEKPENLLPKAWIDSSVPVILDFFGPEMDEENETLENHLYCITKNKRGIFYLGTFKQSSFIKNVTSGDWFIKKEKQQELKKPETQIQGKLKRRESNYYYEKGEGQFRKKWRF